MTCIFESNHKGISLDKYGGHLKKYKARLIVRQSVLKPDDERKGGAKTRRVKGESYHQGTVLISSKHLVVPCRRLLAAFAALIVYNFAACCLLLAAQQQLPVGC
ncbi:hypothetical protein N9U05_00225 [bacterium]|nr:hypothetical protein [bacterium]